MGPCRKQGGCNGVTRWRAGYQDLGWCPAFLGKAPWENERHLLKIPLLGNGTWFSLLAIFFFSPLYQQALKSLTWILKSKLLLNCCWEVGNTHSICTMHTY